MALLDRRRRYAVQPKESKYTGYLRFTAVTSGQFILTIPNGVSTSNVTSVSYSLDNGATWVKTNNAASAITITTPNVQAGDTVLWKGKATQYAYQGDDISRSSTFSSTCTFNVDGNILSLLYEDDFDGKESVSGRANFQCLFRSSAVINAGSLLLPKNIQTYSYGRMFQFCNSLVSAPEIPSTTITQKSCYYMFGQCPNLVNVPDLHATIVAIDGCNNMFSECTSLIKAPALPAMTVANSAYLGMFYKCTSLTKAPVLPAKTLNNYCYQNMFYGCTSLKYIKALFTTTPGTNYTQNWVKDVPTGATGTFVKSSEATWNVVGVHGIPSGWTVQTADS